MKSLLFFVMALSALAAPQNVPQNNNGAIEGTVRRFSTGEPVPEVQVRLGNLVGVTDRNGHFIIDNVPPGAYAVSIQRSGFVVAGQGPTPGGLASPVGRITLGPNEQIRNFRVALDATGAISGRVVGANGAPLPNVVIQGLRRAYQDGRTRLAPFNLPAAARTDDRGEYRVYSLPPGEYYILAQPPPVSPPAGQGITPAYFPGTRDPDKAAPLLVKEGDEISRVDFVLQSGPAALISGNVIPASPEAPFTQFSVAAIPRGPEAGPITSFAFTFNPSASPPGEFAIRTFPLAPGAYDILVSATGREIDYFGMAPVEIGDRSIEGLAVTVRPGADVAGRVTTRGNAADLRLSAIPVSLRSPAYSTTYRAIRLGYEAMSQDLRARTNPAEALAPIATPTEIGANGAFTLRSVPPGQYTFVPALPQGACLLDVLQEGKSILDTGMTVGSQNPSPIEVIVASSCAMLEGSLESAQQPQPFRRVVLVPSAPRRHSFGLFLTAMTDQHGRFYFDGVPPGQYKLFAWRSIPDNAWTNEKYLAAYENRGTTVEVTEAGRFTDLKVEMIPD